VNFSFRSLLPAGVIRVELDVPARMVTKDEICNIFHYVSQVCFDPVCFDVKFQSLTMLTCARISLGCGGN